MDACETIWRNNNTYTPIEERLKLWLFFATCSSLIEYLLVCSTQWRIQPGIWIEMYSYALSACDSCLFAQTLEAYVLVYFFCSLDLPRSSMYRNYDSPMLWTLSRCLDDASTSDAMRQLNGTSAQSLLPRRNNLKHFLFTYTRRLSLCRHCLQAMRCLRCRHWPFEKREKETHRRVLTVNRMIFVVFNPSLSSHFDG